MDHRGCSVPGCSASDRNFGTVLFNVPQDVAPRWAKVLETSSLSESSTVCWSHFGAGSLIREAVGRVKLKDGAEPTLFLGGDDRSVEASNFCRFCAGTVEEGAGLSLGEMLKAEDSEEFLGFLLKGSDEDSASGIVCDDCLMEAKFSLRFVRNVRKASLELKRIAEALAKSEVKSEMDEFGEIPIGSVEPEVKMEVTSLAEFSDRDDEDSDDEDDIPLARRVDAEKAKKEPEQKSAGPLSCLFCDFTCSKPKQLAGHRKKHKNLVRSDSPTESVEQPLEEEKPTPEGYLQCPECPYTCERLVQMASHKKKHTGRKTKSDRPEPDAKELYECEFCDFTCKQRRQMAGHRASHSNMIKKSKPSGKERDHMCSICGKILSTRGSFFVHMKYHNDQRDYECQMCDKKFYSKRDVAMHVESFHEKKTFECEICGVKCTWKNALYKHMRKHDASSFKHECSYCGKKFIAANELRVHIWRHTGQQLNCEICGAGYRFNFLLTQHKIREHGVQIEGVKLYKRFQKGKGKVKGKEQESEVPQPNYPSPPPQLPPTQAEHHNPAMEAQLSYHEVSPQPDHGGPFQQIYQ